MDATLITAIGAALLAPILAVVVLFINKKFSAEVVMLKAEVVMLKGRLQACEDKWDKLLKEKSGG